MKESIGATWIMTIVIFFVILFSGYLALSINYSKAFRVKDGIVDRLQKHNGPNTNSLNDIAEYMSDIGYNSKGYCTIFSSSELDFIGVNQTTYAQNSDGKFNYCIQKVYSAGSSEQMFGAYYKVVVFFTVSIPIFQNISFFNVTGETIYLQYPNDQCFR